MYILLQESNFQFIALEIERIGGSISTVDIQYEAYPLGQTPSLLNTVACDVSDFDDINVNPTDLLGATGLVTFTRGVMLLPINVIAADDTIPEVHYYISVLSCTMYVYQWCI